MADEKLNILTLAMAKKYTDNSLAGAGAVAGVPCQIQSITPITGGNRVTFLWEDNNNVSHTSTLDVMDGAGGEENKIDSISVNGSPISIDENKNVDITVPSIEGLTKDTDLATVAKSGSYEDLSNKPEIPSVEGFAKTTDIPTKVSELENDSNYLSSIPEEYVTETELEAKGYLTEHQDISGKVDKVEGKSLISDTEIARLASVNNYDDTDIRTELANKADTTSIPSKVSELTNDSNYQTSEQVNSAVTTEIAKVVADAPESLNTLKEMSDWIAGHENDASAMNSAISDNKTAIASLQSGKADKSDIPTTVAELTDSADYAKKTDLHSHTNKTVLDGITSTKVSNWDAAKTHADSAHAPSNAQANVIESVKVNGSALSVSSKAVNVDLSGYAVNEDLDTLEYSEVAGGKNLIDVKKVILGDMMEGKVASGNNYITDFIHLEYGKKYILSNCYKQAYETAWFTQDKKFVQRTFGTELTPPTNDCYYVRIEYGVEAGINAQLEEGTTATPYEPYIPSVKMLADEVTDSIGTINTSLANYSIPLNISMGTNHYLAIKVNVHDMNYYFNMSDRSGNIYEGSFFSYNNSFSVQITKINNSLTKIGYILGFRQYKVSTTEVYLVAKASDYNSINGVINTPSVLKSNIEIIVNDDSTLWDSGTDIVVKDVGYINDSSTGDTNSTWSSSKINSSLNDKAKKYEPINYSTSAIYVNDEFIRNMMDYVFSVLKEKEPGTLGGGTIKVVELNKYFMFQGYCSPSNLTGTVYEVINSGRTWSYYFTTTGQKVVKELATMDKLGGLTFSASGTTLSITDGTHTWTLEANS